MFFSNNLEIVFLFFCSIKGEKFTVIFSGKFLHDKNNEIIDL